MHHVGILYDQFMMHGQRNIKLCYFILAAGLRSSGWKMRMLGRKDGEYLCCNGGRERVWDGSELCSSMIWGIGEKVNVFRSCINLP